ncbi:MAG: electron transfer flavoprotein subunit alpha/FixB family protein [Cyanobacteria bacterium SZAS LIN-2]|nr:electron transfer flavoprotein subunit alpha/FixB family protein [Cyanobacteria bacterium SZAS LIN-3]MBS1995815.1 electron transfer flavoprotein subunit alpha/FixB family protein [Cyanobacteria bacterium SZAS LIN-2]MBS2006594.1 electron transfer flavoprotein subunit alpha/FixB family protein [Cyanobacteria bacterium SZAS TMP-1]
MTEQPEQNEPLPDVSGFCPKGDVLVIAEQILGELQPVTLELLGAGRILADKMDRQLKCLVIGHNLGDMPQKLVEYGADEVYVADHEDLASYRTLPYRRVVCDFLESLPEPPHTCLLGSTTTGRDLAPRIAAHFDTGLTADCTELDIGPYEHKSKVDPSKIGLYPNCLYAIRPSFGESLKARILGPWKNPQMATTRPGVMIPLKPDSKRQGKITRLNVTFQPDDYRLIVADTVREISKGVKLTEADVIIGGGFGLGSADGFDLLKELAGKFENSAIGASRKVVDLGWIPYQHQVGQTGKTVRPKLYIACGISGAIQHRVGMSKSGLIIAINKDPDSPIFKFAHHGIVGDIYQIIPEMIKQFEAVQSGRGVEAVVGSH